MTSAAMNNRRCRWAVTLSVCCLLLITFRCEAQNLVPNPSFEEPDSCPGRHTFLTTGEGPLMWFSGGGTPDFFQSCVPSPNEASVPLHDYAFQYPQEGENYIGLLTYELTWGGTREYAMIQLTTPLLQGQTYTVSFYANAAWNGTDSIYPQHYLASSHIGALFTMQPRPWSGFDPLPLPIGTAHVFHPWIISDTVDWTLVSGSFVADSAYQYLMLGNHFDNSITDTLYFIPPLASLPKAFTLIDNVCVTAGTEGCPMANGIAEGGANDLLVFPNPVSDVLRIRGVAAGQGVIIHDVCGRLIWRDIGSGGELKWDVQDCAAGLYMLRVEHAGGHRSFKFLVYE